MSDFSPIDTVYHRVRQILGNRNKLIDTEQLIVDVGTCLQTLLKQPPEHKVIPVLFSEKRLDKLPQEKALECLRWLAQFADWRGLNLNRYELAVYLPNQTPVRQTDTLLTFCCRHLPTAAAILLNTRKTRFLSAPEWCKADQIACCAGHSGLRHHLAACQPKMDPVSLRQHERQTWKIQTAGLLRQARIKENHGKGSFLVEDCLTKFLERALRELERIEQGRPSCSKWQDQEDYLDQLNSCLHYLEQYHMTFDYLARHRDLFRYACRHAGAGACLIMRRAGYSPRDVDDWKRCLTGACFAGYKDLADLLLARKPDGVNEADVQKTLSEAAWLAGMKQKSTKPKGGQRLGL